MDFEIDAEKPLSEVFCGRREKEMLSLFRWLSTADTRLCRAEWRWQNPGVKEGKARFREVVRWGIFVGAIYPKGTSVGRTNRPPDRRSKKWNYTFVLKKSWMYSPPSGREVDFAEQKTKGARESESLYKKFESSY